MSDPIIRVARSRRRLGKTTREFLKKPVNTSLIILLLTGICLLTASGNIHPVNSTTISQQNVYPVTSNITNDTGFSLFPNKVTYAQFEMPENQKVSFSLNTLVKIHVFPSAANPTGVKIIWKHIANGTAERGTVIPIRSPNGAFIVSSVIDINSITGGSYNVTVNSYAYYNTSLSFSPKYAVTGLALIVISSTLIASAVGIKAEEF